MIMFYQMMTKSSGNEEKSDLQNTNHHSQLQVDVETQQKQLERVEDSDSTLRKSSPQQGKQINYKKLSLKYFKTNCVVSLILLS